MTYKSIGNKRQLLSGICEKVIVKMRLKSTCWDSVSGHNQCAIVFVTYVSLKQFCF